MSVLELRDLSVTYRTEGGDGAGRARGEPDDRGRATRSGWPASRAAARPRSPAPSCGCCPPARGSTGQVLLDGEDVYADEARPAAGGALDEAAIVFQGALHSLNPVQRVGAQIAEAILLHGSVTRARRAATRGSASCSSRSASRRRGRVATRTSCRAGSVSGC